MVDPAPIPEDRPFSAHEKALVRWMLEHGTAAAAEFLSQLTEVRVVSLIGSLSDVLLARYAPKAQIMGAKDGDAAILLMQAGRADCIIYALIQALGVSAKAPMLEQVTLLQGPPVALPSAMGVQTEPDRRWRDYLDSWTDYNNGTRQVGAWMRQSLLAMGVKAESIPSNADL